MLGFAVLLAIAAAWLGSQLKLDRSIEHMFAPDDPILQPYHQLQETFGQFELAMAVYSDPELASDEGLARLKQFAEQVQATPGVVAAVSLHDPPGAADFENTGRGKRLRQVFSGYTHNSKLDAAGVVCLLSKPTDSGPSRRQTLGQLRKLVTAMPEGALVGEPVLIEEAFDLLEVDGRRLNVWCTILLMITIFACMPGLRWLVLPLVVVQLALALTRCSLVALGLELSMVSSMLAAIVTVVGVATVVHIIVRFRDARLQDLPPVEALLQATRFVAAPVLFACLTDAAGFAALMTSHVGPVHDFGLMMAIGSIMVLVSVIIAAPGIVLLGNRRPAEQPTRGEAKLRESLGRLLAWSQRHWLLISIVGIVITVAAALGSARLTLETNFIRNFREESKLVQGYQFVEQRFEGAGVWDIVLPPIKRMDKKYLVRLVDFEASLRKEVPLLSKAISVADILEGGIGQLSRLNFGANIAIRAGLAKMFSDMPEFTEAVYARNVTGRQEQIRILLRSPEQLEAAEKTRMIEAVQRAADEEFPGAQVTGYYVLLTQLIESLLRDQWTTFGVAAVAILTMMAVAFRSVSLAVATLVPNALPVLVLFGAMGWLGIRVNMGAAMIAAVSLGLSVDGSIHYVMSYQRSRRGGMSVDEALQTVQSIVGRAAVFATLALVVGFATLCFSEFVPTVYFGALVSLSMIGGLVGNLMVLPLLIRVVEPKNERDQSA